MTKILNPTEGHYPLVEGKDDFSAKLVKNFTALLDREYPEWMPEEARRIHGRIYSLPQDLKEGLIIPESKRERVFGMSLAGWRLELDRLVAGGLSLSLYRVASGTYRA